MRRFPHVLVLRPLYALIAPMSDLGALKAVP
jgi:hypothetical protein